MENQIESVSQSCSAHAFPRSPAMPFGWPLPRGGSLPGKRKYLARTVRIPQTPTVWDRRDKEERHVHLDR
jgi:hypothetical protein